MNNVYADNQVPKGSYICLNCGEEQNIYEKGILSVCPFCGYDEFKSTILIELTDDEIKEKFNECINLIAISSYLFERYNLTEFLNVMAINLRILLCDGEGSLLPKIIPDLKFKKGIFDSTTNLIFPENLFASQTMLSLSEFLSQVVVKRPEKKSVTIGKMIKSVANKCGGAHVDSELFEDFYLSSSVSKYYFVEISKYIVTISGFDYNEIIKNFNNNFIRE